MVISLYRQSGFAGHHVLMLVNLHITKQKNSRIKEIEERKLLL